MSPTPLMLVPALVFGLHWPQFLSPGRLWVLVLLPLLALAYIILLRLKGRTGIRFTNTGLLGAILPKQSQWRRHVAVAMSLCSLVALSMAWARPLGIEKVPRQRATVVVVIDVSQSMAATDVKPTRLATAKKAAEQFIASLPSAYNVSVVSLSAKPQILMPPSIDRSAINAAIDNLELQDGTAIGSAITTALAAIKQAPVGTDKTVAPAMVVMLSDGTNTDGPSPLDGVAQARAAKVPIYTISYGTDNGYVDLDGTRYRVPPDKALMAQIASSTGGRAVTAETAGQLDKAYQDLKSSVGYEDVRKERTAEYAMYALAFAVVAALGAVSMATRWP